jgi:hypothetical protein
MTDIILSAIIATLGDKGASYFQRPAGSTVEGLDPNDGDAAATWLKSLDWSDVTEEVRANGAGFGACRYYRAYMPDGFTGREGAIQAKTLAGNELERVRLQHGHHGNLELIMLGEWKLPETGVVHILVADTASWGDNGPTEEPTIDTARVVTWYPGRVLPVVALENATVKKA